MAILTTVVEKLAICRSRQPSGLQVTAGAYAYRCARLLTLFKSIRNQTRYGRTSRHTKHDFTTSSSMVGFGRIKCAASMDWSNSRWSWLKIFTSHGGEKLAKWKAPPQN